MQIKRLFVFLTILFLFFVKGYSTNFSIVFVHLDYQLPRYAEVAIDQAALFNTECAIYLLSPLKIASSLHQKYRKTNVHLIPIEQIKKSPSHKAFIKHSKKNHHPDLETFFYLNDFIRQNNLTSIFYLKTHVMLYTDLNDLFPLFKTLYSHIAATFDNDEYCSSGFMYFANQADLQHLVNFIEKQELTQQTVMETLAHYYQYYPDQMDYLPITVKNYEHDYPMISISGQKSHHKYKYTNHIELFKSIFDATAFGSYLDGAKNYMHTSEVGYINPISLINPRHFTYVWELDSKHRKIPYVIYRGEKYRINNLSITSKNLAKFLSSEEK